jgi:hypothetical protein
LEDLLGSGGDNRSGAEPRRLPDPILRLRFLMVGSHPRFPFKGHGHYDSDLDAWVGTQTIFNKDDCSRNQHLCSCDVPEIGEGKAMPAPDWKLAEKTLTFLEEPLKSMYGSTLLPMGCTGDDVFGRAGMLCLIERTLPPGVPFRRYISDGGEKSEVSPPCDHVPS